MVSFLFLMLLFWTKLHHCNCVARGADTSNPCPGVVGTVGHGYTSFIIPDVGACCYCNAGSYMKSICLKDQPPNSRVCTPCQFNSDKPDEQYFISAQPHNLNRCKLSMQTCPNGLTRINGNTTSDAQCVFMNSTTTTPLTTLPVISSPIDSNIPGWGIVIIVLILLFILGIVCYCGRDEICSILRNQRCTQRSDQAQNSSSLQPLQTTALSNGNNATPSSDGDVAVETNALLGGETQENLSVRSESRPPSSDITRPDDGHLPNSHVINETSLSNGGSSQQDHPTSSNQSVSNPYHKLYKDPEDESDDHKETVVEMLEFGYPSDAANSDLKAIPDENNFISSPDDPGTSQSPNQPQTGNSALNADDNRVETQSETATLIPYIDEGNNSRVINADPPDIRKSRNLENLNLVSPHDDEDVNDDHRDEIAHDQIPDRNHQPRDVNAHDQPHDRNVHDQPHDRNVHNQPHDRNVHDQPHDRNVHNQPHDNNVHNQPHDRNVHDQPHDRNVHDQPHDRNVPNIETVSSHLPSSSNSDHEPHIELMWAISDRLCESEDDFLTMADFTLLLIEFGYRRLEQNFRKFQTLREDRIRQLFEKLEEEYKAGKLNDFPQRFVDFLRKKNLKNILNNEMESLYLKFSNKHACLSYLSALVPNHVPLQESDDDDDDDDVMKRTLC